VGQIFTFMIAVLHDEHYKSTFKSLITHIFVLCQEHFCCRFVSSKSLRVKQLQKHYLMLQLDNITVIASYFLRNRSEGAIEVAMTAIKLPNY
jgi:hypothetical protein